MKIGNHQYPLFCTADARSTQPLELFSLEQQKSRLRISASLDLTQAVKDMMDDVPGWLPFAAEKYNISANLRDYILNPVVSMPSDLPNKNGQAFPYHQLSAWSPVAGMPMFKTWKGKGVYEEHDSDDWTKSSGIIFSSMLLPITNTVGNIWKVAKLVGVDRNRNSIFANNILTKKSRHWSMGAYAEDYDCSICGNKYSNGDCEHVEADNTKPPEFKIFNQMLAYWNVVNPIGFEISGVKAPAYSSAEDTNYFTFKD